MKAKLDLHENFLGALRSKSTKKDVVAVVAEILKLEKDAAYRRVSGKVNFSIREMGILADKMNISLDRLMSRSEKMLWLPYLLDFPRRVTSTDTIIEFIESSFEYLKQMDPMNAECGNLYNTLPMEYFLHSPVLTKFMFFKWGYYFMNTNDFYNYSAWELPAKVNGMLQRLAAVYNFSKAYYIWDISLVFSLVREIRNFHKMLIISTEEKEEIKRALKGLLTMIEECLNGNCDSTMEFMADADFYVSSIPIGFTSNYFLSGKTECFIIHTPFSSCRVYDDHDYFLVLKTWVDSFKDLSTLLSHSGRIERRLFFEEQHLEIDFLLG